MERELWIELRRRLAALPPRRPAKAQFTDRDIVGVVLWAALHDRPIAWACRPSSWPGPRRRLPSASTVSRRSRTLSALKTLRRLSPRRRGALLACLDGKPLAVGRFSKDREARRGYGAGAVQRGYKLHAACDRRGRLLAFAVRPMDEAECVTGRKLATRAGSSGTLILADASYDANALYARAAGVGARLLAPRRKAGRSVSAGHAQHPDRLSAIARLEGDGRKRAQASRLRSAVERSFGWLTMRGGGAPPPWARTLRRVRRWVMAKLAILDAAMNP